MLKKLHHVAYRCRDAAETVDFYTRGIGLKFAATMINHVPSTGLKAVNNNVFFEMEDGSYICFFEILGSKEPVVPVENDWAQHLALEVRDEARAEEISARLRALGVDVAGPVVRWGAGALLVFQRPERPPDGADREARGARDRHLGQLQRVGLRRSRQVGGNEEGRRRPCGLPAGSDVATAMKPMEVKP
ncbi:Glyoxalase family protein [Ralstonia solanacearum SD54]|nr:Glyoxalase family protein [Ralstonia solanacearum SD54]